MNGGQKLKSLISGSLMILAGLLMLFSWDHGYIYVFLVLAVSLIAEGISKVIYYFSMARFMVMGRFQLYEGIISLSFGIFAVSQMDAKRSYVIVYLVLGLLFRSLIEVIRAFEQRKVRSGKWKRTLAIGLFGILYTGICLCGATQSANFLSLAYIAGVIADGIQKIVSAFRRTAVPEIPQ